MSRSVNKAIILGNLTRDPEMRYTPSGNAVTSFAVATNRQWSTDDGSTKEDTEFHNIVAWNKLAELCSQLLKKGTKVYIEGRLQTRSWDDAKGLKHYKTEIVADDMIVLTSKSDREAVSEPLGAKGPVADSSRETANEEKKPEVPGSSDETVDTEEMPF